jgi:hypothetical protein
VIGHQPLELLAGVLAAAIGMMQQSVRFAPSPDCHHQGVGDELGRHRCAHRPANHTAGELIDDGSHIEPALRCPHIGEVSDPFAVGSGRFEAPIEHVGSDGGDLPLPQIGRQSTPSRARFKGLQPHQSFDPVQPARYPFGEQVVPHPPGAIGPIAAQEARANLRSKLFIASAALTARPCQPGIEPTPRDTERPAHPIHGPDSPVLRNEGELHVDSFAK